MVSSVQIKRKRAKKKEQAQQPQQQQPQKNLQSQEQQNQEQATQQQRQEEDETVKLQKPVVGDTANPQQQNPQQQTTDEEVKRSQNETPANSQGNQQDKRKSNLQEHDVSQNSQQEHGAQGKQTQTQHIGTQSQKVEKKPGAKVKLGIKRGRKLENQKNTANTALKTAKMRGKNAAFKLPPIPALPPNWTAYKTKTGRQYYHKTGICAVLFGSNILLDPLAIPNANKTRKSCVTQQILHTNCACC